MASPQDEAAIARFGVQSVVKFEGKQDSQLPAENSGTTGRKRQRVMHEPLEYPERQREIVELSENEFAQGRALAPTQSGIGNARLN